MGIVFSVGRRKHAATCLAAWPVVSRAFGTMFESCCEDTGHAPSSN